MLTATFLHAQGVGETTERRLWENGFTSWESVLAASPSELPLTEAQKRLLIPTLERSVTAIETEDWRYFAEVLPAGQQWRAAPALMDRIGFLDIETNGGTGPDAVTIVGVYDGEASRIYVEGQDLDEFAADSERYSLWVTFFGTGFDLPMLRRRFPNVPFDQLHIDLCPALRRLGYRGGLKSIERQLGIDRADEIAGMTGMDAVYLWKSWCTRNNRSALNKLIAYNRADVENLSLLLAFAYQKLKAASGFPG